MPEFMRLQAHVPAEGKKTFKDEKIISVFFSSIKGNFAKVIGNHSFYKQGMRFLIMAIFINCYNRIIFLSLADILA